MLIRFFFNFLQLRVIKFHLIFVLTQSEQTLECFIKCHLNHSRSQIGKVFFLCFTLSINDVLKTQK